MACYTAKNSRKLVKIEIISEKPLIFVIEKAHWLLCCKFGAVFLLSGKKLQYKEEKTLSITTGLAGARLTASPHENKFASET